jgi:hypothetical protein
MYFRIVGELLRDYTASLRRDSSLHSRCCENLNSNIGNLNENFLLQIAVCYDAMPRSLEGKYRRFEGVCHFLLQFQEYFDLVGRFHQKVGTYLRVVVQRRI